jgi:hypothetical protein
MNVIPIFWLSVPDEGYSNLLTEYLMKVILISWLSVPDEGYSNLLTECTW